MIVSLFLSIFFGGDGSWAICCCCCWFFPAVFGFICSDSAAVIACSPILIIYGFIAVEEREGARMVFYVINETDW